VTNIEWYFPERGKGIDKSISDIVTHFPGVEREIRLKANSMASEAWVQLLWHHKSGAAKVEVGRHPNDTPRSPDWYVYLKDADPGGEGKAGRNKYQRSAMSIEFGWTTKKGTDVPGLNILGSVMHRAAAKYGGPR
jgi:hypothetical protein